jgi:biopolymer transport protein TolR
MAMRLGGRGSVASEINVTPMIDVLLVLLVIFMVLQQGLTRGVSVQVPPPETEHRVGPQRTADIVLAVEPGGRYWLNNLAIASGRLRETLAEVYAERPRKVLFVKGSEALTYGEVVAAVDAARSAGVVVVGLVPRATGTGG